MRINVISDKTGVICIQIARVRRDPRGIEQFRNYFGPSDSSLIRLTRIARRMNAHGARPIRAGRASLKVWTA